MDEGLLSGFTLGFDETELSELKPEVESVLQQQRKKKAKFTHDFFFEEEGGFKKILAEFPKIRFRGKGHEFEDLARLLGHYHRWYQGLEPSANDLLEDAVWTTRNKLAEKEKDDAGIQVSDPRERLHKFRAIYKTNQRATPGSSAGPSGGPARIQAPLPEEQKKRVEENRQRALERKRQKQLELGQLEDPHEAHVLHAEPMHFEEADEDVFGLGFGFDEEPAGRRIAATVQADVVAGGGHASGDNQCQAELLKQQKELEALDRAHEPQSAPMYFEEEDEDVFGLGFGFDEEPSGQKPAGKVQTNGGGSGRVSGDGVDSKSQGQAKVSESMQQKIEANRQRALALKQQRQEALIAQRLQDPEAGEALDVDEGDRASDSGGGNQSHTKPPDSSQQKIEGGAAASLARVAGVAPGAAAQEASSEANESQAQLSASLVQTIEANKQRAQELRQARRQVPAQAGSPPAPQDAPNPYQAAAQQQAVGPSHAAHRELGSPRQGCAQSLGQPEMAALTRAPASILTAQEEQALEADELAFGDMEDDDVFGFGFGLD